MGRTEARLARVAWFAVVALVLAVFVISIPPYFAYLHVVVPASNLSTGQLDRNGVAALHSVGLSIDTYAAYHIVLNAVFLLGFLGVGAAIFWRKADNRMALLTSFALVTFSLGFSGNVDQVKALSASLPLPGQVIAFASGLGLALVFYLFPSGRFVPRWAGWLMAGWTIHQLLFGFFSSGIDQYPALSLFDGVLFISLLISLLAAQVYRYRRVSTPVERQQTKWVLFGFTAAIGGFVATLVITVLLVRAPEPGTLFYFGENTMIDAFLLCIPVSIGIAIMRSHLYDIDIIINRTLVYGPLTATLALVYWGGVALLQELIRPITGGENDLAIVASTLIIAGLFFPLRRAIQGFIDRRFYRRKYDAAHTLSAFGQVARDEVDLGTLTGRLVGVVDETMQPAHVSLWLREPRKG